MNPSATPVKYATTFWPIRSPIGQIVFIDPESKEIFAMDGDRRDPEKILGNLEKSIGGEDWVHIGTLFWTLTDDPRLKDGRVIQKGPYLIKDAPS